MTKGTVTRKILPLTYLFVFSKSLFNECFFGNKNSITTYKEH